MRMMSYLVEVVSVVICGHTGPCANCRLPVSEWIWFVAKKTLSIIEEYCLTAGKTLFAGVVDGRNIWANDLAASVLVKELQAKLGKDIMSWSRLRVPCSTALWI